MLVTAVHVPKVLALSSVTGEVLRIVDAGMPSGIAFFFVNAALLAGVGDGDDPEYT